MQIFYLKEDFFSNFLDILNKEHQIYVPFRTAGKKTECDFGFTLPTDEYLLKKYSPEVDKVIAFNPYRTIEPLRAFFTYPKESVAAYFNSGADKPSPDKKVAVLGVKNCDLFSLKIQDFVFLEGVTKDPVYEKRRNDTLLIAGDCLAFKEACFCLALEIKPFVQEGFDLNLSPLNDGFLVDVGSQKGEDIANKANKYLSPATAAQISARDKKRDALVAQLKKHLDCHNIPPKSILQEIVKKGHDSQIWSQEALRCVECGGCNFMCDTCHCFLLSDQRFGNVNERVRLWDACLYANFARVAGGANPLKHRYQRLRNRYLKKFDFFPDNLGLAACCGCGRCIDVCPGKIDIRYILKKLNDEKSLSTH